MTTHLKIAVKFLLKHFKYSLLNIAGLVISLVAVFLIMLYVHDELSFDGFHKNKDRIFRVIENKTNESGTVLHTADVAFKIADIPDMLPQVEKATRLMTFGRTNILNDENSNKFYEDLVFTDQDFLKIFDFKLISGNRDEALKDPNTVIMTETEALKIFGTTDILGKTIRNDRVETPFRITGILRDFPSNSHLKFNLLFSMASNASSPWYKKFETGDWSNNYFATYLLLNQEVSPKIIEQKLTSLVLANRSNPDDRSTFSLQSLPDIHFNSQSVSGGFNYSPGIISYVYIFSTVALFIFIIACINYINLSTAFSLLRGKEVGIKKVSGASRMMLAGQFLSESISLVIISVIVAIIFTTALLPVLNNFTGKSISTGVFLQPGTIGALTCFTILMGIISGIYPSMVLSAMKPLHAIKSISMKTGSSGLMRKSLVIFQFTLSILLIISTVTAYRQINFVRNKNLGFNQDQLVVLDINSGSVRKSFQAIKDLFYKIPDVKNVSVSSRVPGEWKNLPQVKLEIVNNPVEETAYFIGADEDFLSTFQIALKEGRNFIPGNKADSSGILINQAAAKQFGITTTGQELIIQSVNFGAAFEKLDHPFRARVLGIVNDFNFQSLYNKIDPLIIASRENPVHSIDYFTVRLSQGNWNADIKKIGDGIHQVDPAHIIEYNFLDKKLQDFYFQDIQRKKLFTAAAFISIALACFGLFSLAWFNTRQRVKEIGIRKVLGASVSQITVLISREYVLMVVAGFIIAVPLSVMILRSWLESFAYRVSLGAGIFLLAGMISLVTAIITVGLRSLNAAMADPVDSLRNE